MSSQMLEHEMKLVCCRSVLRCQLWGGRSAFKTLNPIAIVHYHAKISLYNHNIYPIVI